MKRCTCIIIDYTSVLRQIRLTAMRLGTSECSFANRSALFIIQYQIYGKKDATILTIKLSPGKEWKSEMNIYDFLEEQSLLKNMNFSLTSYVGLISRAVSTIVCCRQEHTYICCIQSFGLFVISHCWHWGSVIMNTWQALLLSAFSISGTENSFSYTYLFVLQMLEIFLNFSGMHTL